MRLPRSPIKPKGKPASQVPWPPPPGSEIRLCFPFGPNGNRLFHVLAVAEGVALVRNWQYRGQRWSFSVLEAWFYEDHMENLTVVLPEPDPAQKGPFQLLRAHLSVHAGAAGRAAQADGTRSYTSGFAAGELAGLQLALAIVGEIEKEAK